MKTEAVSNSDVQVQILKILADKENYSSYYGVHRSVMSEKLSISEKDMDLNLAYLQYKRFVKLVEAPNCSWFWAKITPHGLNHIKRIAEELANAEHIADAFQSAHELTREQTYLSETERSLTIEKLYALEKELAKNEPDAGSIQELCKWLGQNAKWTEPVLHKTVIEVIRQNLF